MASTIGITWADDLFTDLKAELAESAPAETTLIRFTNRVAREMNSELDLESVINTATLYFCGENAISYAQPTDMKSDGLIEIRSANTVVDRPIRLISPSRFSKYSAGEFVCIEKDAGVECFKILHDQFDGNSILFAPCETSVTAEGTWSAGTGVTNITHDSYDYRFGNGAINFDTNGELTATISFVRTSVLDISDFTNQQRLRLWMKLPTAPSSIAVRWGSDSSNYFSHSLTTQVNGASFATSGWNELEAVQASATATGTPDLENIDYFALVLTFALANTDTDYIIDEIRLIKPEEMQVEYYSKYIGKTIAGVYSEGLTVSASTTDLLVLYNELREIVIAGVCWKYLRMRGDKQAKADSEYYRQIYENGKNRIKIKYPSRRAISSRRRSLPRLY